MTPAELALYIDHTLLAPEATSVDLQRLCNEAATFRVAAICVSPSLLPLSQGQLPAAIATACVVGFPSGAHSPLVKGTEAQQAYEHGADEIDMVINLGNIRSENWTGVRDDIAAVRSVIPSTVILKVIIESAVLTDSEIVQCCRIAVDAGAQFVKTSTGFHKAGGATVDAVKLMRRTVGPNIGVKASGGIRSFEDAMIMIEAGASRIGASATAAILAGAQDAMHK
ncbi:MAG: deoxyribose-phosphate aldolase [Ilumatobacteraceae bacterium]